MGRYTQSARANSRIGAKHYFAYMDKRSTHNNTARQDGIAHTEGERMAYYRLEPQAENNQHGQPGDGLLRRIFLRHLPQNGPILKDGCDMARTRMYVTERDG